MKPTNFSVCLTNFLSKYLPHEIGTSSNTIASYRDTFILLLRYFKEKQKISAERLKLNDMTKETIIKFLDWIEEERNCSPQTRNVRLAAIHSFFRYMQYENPGNILEWQKILSIPAKKVEKSLMNYISINGVKLLLNQPDQSTISGRRDLAMLALLYDSAARVQELIDLTPSSIRFDDPSSVKLTGKGNKTRIVPLMSNEANLLRSYMEEHNLMNPSSKCYPLFFNKRKEKLTRSGVNYILKKYVKLAHNENSLLIPDKFTPHCLRHSKSMHLLQAGVNLVYIRDILGHVSIQTTEIYARADSKQKREAIEKAYTGVVSKNKGIWHDNPSLIKWLKSLC